MSWDSYISGHLLASLPHGGSLTHAAIYGQDGGVWAKSDNFPELTPEQVSSLVKGFDDGDHLAQSGIWIGDQKFLMITGIPGDTIRGRQGGSGLCIKKTHTAMVIGIYGDGVEPADCNVLVEGLGDYLMEMNV